MLQQQQGSRVEVTRPPIFGGKIEEMSAERVQKGIAH